MGERVSRVRATWRETTDRDRVDQPISDRLTVCDSINVRLKSALQRFVKYRKDGRFTLSILITKRFNFRIVSFFFRIFWYRTFQEAFWVWFFSKNQGLQDESRWSSVQENGSIRVILIGEIWFIIVLSQMFRSGCNVINNNHFNPFPTRNYILNIFRSIFTINSYFQISIFSKINGHK